MVDSLVRSNRETFPAALRSATLLLSLSILVASCARPPGTGDVRGNSNARGETPGDSREFTYDREAGTELTLLANDHPWVSLIEDRLDEFTELTGIDVEISVYPEEQFRAKREVEMRSGTTDIDLFMIMPGQSLSKYVAEGWAAPLDGFIDDESLLWPEYEVEDFYEAVIESGSREGKQYTLPILLETSLLAYNREILDRFDVPVPGTMEELEEAARFIFEQSGGEIAGITLRGRGASATSQWADFLYSFGGSWFDEAGNGAIHSDASLEALRFYGDLLRNWGPRGASSNRWYESVSLFTSGRAAMIYDANVFRPNYEDPESSEIASHVGYAQIPAGPAGRVPHISHWGLSLYENSPRKEAGWLFVQWATGRDIALAAQERGIPSARESVWSSYDSTSEWTHASTRNYEIAESMWNPPVMKVDAARAAVGSALIAAILSDDVEEAARSASQELDRIAEDER